MIKLFKSRHYLIEHSLSCDIGGYVIVTAKAQVTTISSLSGDALLELGHVLFKVVVGIEKVVRPEKVYCAQFCEEATQLHFHIFPRTQEITEQYYLDYPQHREQIHGPVLLDWAREKFKVSSPEEFRDTTKLTIEALKRELSDNA